MNSIAGVVIIIGAASLIVPLVIITTRENVMITLGEMALAVGFVLKDYLRHLFRGISF